MGVDLAQAFRREEIMDLAGPTYLARGLAYQRDGRVELGAGTDHTVQAVVRGTRPYRVELRVADGEPVWMCTCPLGEDGLFCKHCVAVALAVVGDTAEPHEDTARSVEPAEEEATLSAYLSGLDRGHVEGLVLEAAAGDWRLRQRLLAEAAALAGEGIDIAEWRQRIEVVFAPYDDYVPYREVAEWAAEVGDLIAALEDLVEAGHADAVILLAEHAHRCGDGAQQYLDDSDGYLSEISARVGDLHFRACSVAPPDPVDLARRLVDLELTSEVDAFGRAAQGYAELLGAEGLAEYRRLLTPRWAAIDPLGDGYSSERYRVRSAMVGLALAENDPDALIEIHRRDLRSPDTYAEIVGVLVEAGRVEEAIGWGRRGLDEHGGRHWASTRLLDQVAGLLRGQGQDDEAVALYWAAFERGPALESFRRLLAAVDDPTAAARWSTQALDSLRSRVTGRRDEAATPGPHRSSPATVLVDILLYEDEVDEAWTVAAEHGVDEQHWLALARAREATHPLDAIPVYEREVSAQIATKKNGGYRQAVDAMTRIERLAGEAGVPERFDALLAEVRTQHKAKRNLKALLDQKGW